MHSSCLLFGITPAPKLSVWLVPWEKRASAWICDHLLVGFGFSAALLFYFLTWFKRLLFRSAQLAKAFAWVALIRMLLCVFSQNSSKRIYLLQFPPLKFHASIQYQNIELLFFPFQLLPLSRHFVYVHLLKSATNGLPFLEIMVPVPFCVALLRIWSFFFHGMRRSSNKVSGRNGQLRVSHERCPF